MTRLAPNPFGAQLLVGGAAAVLSVAVLRVGLDDAGQRATTAEVPLSLAVGVSFVVAGLVAWRLRPRNPIGWVMALTGIARLVAALHLTQDPLLFSIARAVQPVWFAGIAYILLSFPDGRLAGRVERALVGATLVATVPLVLVYPWLGGFHGECRNCPDYLLDIADVPAVATPLHNSALGLGAVVAVASVGVLARRWRRASPPLRFAIAPVLWAGAAELLAAGLWLTEMVVRNESSERSDVVLGAVVALVPLAFLAGIARTRMARTAVADLVIELGTASSPACTPSPDCPAPDLKDALARALRDPSLEVAYWLPEGDRYVDADGRPVPVPACTPERGLTIVEQGGRRVAALLHDPALHEDQRLVESVCAAAGLALENGRLQAELQARLADLAASRSRIVEAEEAERRRIERDLHDGAQQRLVSVAMTLGLAEARAAADGDVQTLVQEARSSLAEALQELRRLSQGIHPSILTERGLARALAEVASRAPVPVTLHVALPRSLPPHVEATAYYVVSEALTNMAKHARATTATVDAAEDDGVLTVQVRDDGVGGADEGGGTGLRGLRDRVEAVCGRLTVESPAGEGTTVRAEIPCES